MTVLSRFSRARRIERKAYRWVLEMLDDPTRHAQYLERWLSQDDEHRTVFKRVAIEMGYASDNAALSQKLRTVLADVHSRAPRQSPSRWIAAGVTMAAAVIVAAFVWRSEMPDRQPNIAQRDAPQILEGSEGPKAYKLADNSTVTMLADSVLLVHYSANERGIDLNLGRARFEVQHDTSRPFIVYVRGAKVTAVGTVFEVDATPAKPRVHLITGRVIVTIAAQSPKEAPRAVTLTSGQEIVVGRATSSPQEFVPNSSELMKSEAFDDVPLSEIVSRVNALSTTKIVLGDPSIGSQLIFAELNLHDIHSVARKLALIIGGAVDESEAGKLKIVRTH